MEGRVDYRELTTKALAGALGGFIGWLPIEIAAQGLSFLEPHQPQGIAYALSIYAGLIGGLVNTPFGRLGPKSGFWQFVRTFSLSFFLSMIAEAAAGVTFRGLVFPLANNDIDAYGVIPNYLLAVGTWYQSHNVSLGFIFLARLWAYAIFGAVLGLSVGLTSFSPNNLLKGAVGGGLGGFVGGLFWMLDGDGAIARMCSLTVTGLGIGLFIGLVNELTKVAWLTVEAGRLKGRQFRCDRNVINLGRAEENEVGLFGDLEVVSRHACIERDGRQFVLKDLSRREGTSLNGTRIDRGSLQDGDLIQIGSYRLRFHSRLGLSGGSPEGGSRRSESSISVRSARSLATACLVDQSGNRVVLQPDRVTRLGRAEDSDVILADDRSSRNHAMITNNNGRFFIRDLGSSNGTFVGEVRITEQRLSDGDRIRLGDTRFTFLYRIF
ncbi:MAG TPA: FHA domain-containing protein [Stellaceae bacterium]|nr:FHA domain-containing protein [Stellaceae bacterium]